MPQPVQALHSEPHCIYVCWYSVIPQVPLVVSIDYTKMEAIRMVEGVEERKKLTDGTSGFAVCTWDDGSSYQSQMANLMLHVERQPLRKRKRPAAKKRPAAAAKKRPAAAASSAGSDDEGEEEEDGEGDESEEGDGENAADDEEDEDGEDEEDTTHEK